MGKAKARSEASLVLDATDRDLYDQLREVGSVATPMTTFPSHWLYDGEQRLDASYYGGDARAALRLVEDCKFGFSELRQVAESVFIPGRFKRVYATNRESGWPYLSASSALMFRPSSDRWVAKDHAPAEAEQHFALPGWILVSCSGSVGRAIIATKRLKKYFLTHDLARIVPTPSLPGGYLYAFLASRVGQALLSKDQYGSAIKHLEPHHIGSVPMPTLPAAEQQKIHDEVMRAYALRDEANSLMDEAEELLHSETGLSRFDESLVPYLPVPKQEKAGLPEIPHPRAFITQMSELADRLDVSYHLPVVRTLVGLMREGKYEPVKLGSMAEKVFMPPTYKRIYVKREHGEPILSGAHLLQNSPQDLQFISRKVFNRPPIDTYRIKKGWVLVTGRGTVGKSLGKAILVSNNWDGWLASHNILRIIPTQSANGGYIVAFLLSRYGSAQIEAKCIGAAISVLTPEDLANIWIPGAPPKVQDIIGRRIVSAFEKKDEASSIEEATIRHLEERLERAATHKEALVKNSGRSPAFLSMV